MPKSINQASYLDCYDLMDQALNDSVGARHITESVEAAENLRHRCHRARVLSREYSMKVYPPDHPAHGISVYDTIVFRIRMVEDNIYLYAEKVKEKMDNIELLSTIPEPSIPPPRLKVEILSSLVPFKRRI